MIEIFYEKISVQHAYSAALSTIKRFRDLQYILSVKLKVSIQHSGLVDVLKKWGGQFSSFKEEGFAFVGTKNGGGAHCAKVEMNEEKLSKFQFHFPVLLVP